MRVIRVDCEELPNLDSVSFITKSASGSFPGSRKDFLDLAIKVLMGATDIRANG